jgi:lipoprotein NlpD
MVSFAGCATGITHTVAPGENLYRIGKAYGVRYEKLARVNRLYPPYRLAVGERLFIPNAERRLPVNVITPRATSSARPAPTVGPVSVSGSGRDGFSWPARGRVVTNFGKQVRGHHDGIDISAKRGSAVMAARAGRVIFSDRLTGYGNVIILEHAGGYATVYAHNERNLARKGENIRQGERIATVGGARERDGSHLHFEIRKNNVARNPLYYLPRS